LSLPGYVAFIGFALIAWLQSSNVGSSDAWLLVTVPVGVTTVFCWGFGPFIMLIDIIVFFRDPWRRERSRDERTRLKLWVFLSPIAWLGSNLIVDKYHLLR
jgi:hypothetical protein